MARLSRTVPDGESRERVSCLDCGHVFYENPKMVVGAVVAHEGRILLCRRAIEPRRGFWTLPAGYLELNETPAEGCAREVMEEAGADIVLDGILAIYNIARLSQVQILYRARFANPDDPHIEAGDESLEVGMFSMEEIPRDDIAFPTVHWAIDAYRATADGPLLAPAGNPSADPRGEATLPGDRWPHCTTTDASAHRLDRKPENPTINGIPS